MSAVAGCYDFYDGTNARQDQLSLYHEMLSPAGERGVVAAFRTASRVR
jgi:hypothetical protein